MFGCWTQGSAGWLPTPAVGIASRTGRPGSHPGVMMGCGGEGVSLEVIGDQNTQQ